MQKRMPSLICQWYCRYFMGISTKISVGICRHCTSDGTGDQSQSHPNDLLPVLFHSNLRDCRVIEAVKKTNPHICQPSFCVVGCNGTALGVNATRLMSTKEYADYSTRGPQN